MRIHAWTPEAEPSETPRVPSEGAERLEEVPGIGTARVRAYHVTGGSALFAPTGVFLGTSDPDPHVPFERVRETEAVLAEMGAAVELRRYPGMPHTINQDELEATRALLQRLASGAA